MAALIANLALLVAIAAIIYLLVLLWPERVSIRHQHLVKTALFKREKMPLAELSRITFDYEAVVGFACVWTFESLTGQVITQGSFRINRRLLHLLEAQIQGFTVAAFDQAFKDGDVSDSLELWRRSDPSVGAGTSSRHQSFP